MFLLLIFFSSCGNDPLDVDVSAVEVDLDVKHFEKDLFDYKTSITLKNIDALKIKYDDFLERFTENIISIGSINDPAIAYLLNKFVNDSDIKNVKKDVDSLYLDFTDYQIQLEDGFKHYKYYFPKKKIPKIITYLSGLNYAVVIDSNYLGIGLDMFLGANYQSYKQLGLPQYKTNLMTNKHLVLGVMLGFLSTEFELKEQNSDILTEMVYQGKLLYLLDALFPKMNEELKIGYSEQQLEWCEDNEKDIWFHFIDKELLYNKETKEVVKYMGEAPFTQGFPEGSPGRVGHWVGWNIVKAYMKSNSTISVRELMMETSAQKILNQSKYKP